MFVLFILEFNNYLSVQYQSSIVMDEALDQTLQINFNITVPDLRCEFASLDVSDLTGTRRHNMTTDIYKIRIDAKNRMIGMANSVQSIPKYGDDTFEDLPESDAVVINLTEQTFAPFLKEHHYVAVDFYAPWCIWCKRMEPTWLKVAQTLPNLHFGQRVRIASVDCEAHPQICMQQWIRAYPMILFFKDGDLSPVEMYHGDRTTEAILAKFKSLMEGEIDYSEQRKKQLHEGDKKEAEAKGACRRGAILISIDGQMNMYTVI